MASGSGMPPLLSLKRSTQSGAKQLSAAFAALYEENCDQPYLFGGAVIDLTSMQAGDTVVVKIEKKVTAAGSYIINDQVSYSGAQPATHPVCSISGMPDVYGVRISAQQTAGVLRSVDCEFYDAKRLGLS